MKGGLVGGTIGYNWQMSSFVVGFEGDASWVGEYGSHFDDGLASINNPNGPFTNVQSFTKETWLATARARFGYAVDNLLFYGTGGYAGAGVTSVSRMLVPTRFSFHRQAPVTAGRQVAVSNGDLRPTGRPSSSGST